MSDPHAPTLPAPRVTSARERQRRGQQGKRQVSRRFWKERRVPPWGARLAQGKEVWGAGAESVPAGQGQAGAMGRRAGTSGHTREV